MGVSPLDIYGLLYTFARELGHGHDDAERLAHSVMAEFGPDYVAAARPGSVERLELFKAIWRSRGSA